MDELGELVPGSKNTRKSGSADSPRFPFTAQPSEQHPVSFQARLHNPVQRTGKIRTTCRAAAITKASLISILLR